ncbi:MULTISPECIES: helix-turn-helix transcriptional regulator [unclassified Bradyrhizobium]|uniref:helix-turn-helix domain-containing protein n=1 Tax=unclassified Bradyrhizobium TaxID=2631580 RepID=UPI0023EEFB9E|nr:MULTISPECIES: helix-turn-helix transcriptional regulator [unclassified Bradyrhizobium]MCK1270828.1 helix-turn-helix transcriptional regulator [Bradyrhizobium sp. 84]MCK1372135.1 helix-turn-helix transcriptional regulator [Bradyrhizobium sp. 49]MCK1430594.1 helix-turn-helix transcriptional regulator [Bradyrhizobium sp. 87]
METEFRKAIVVPPPAGRVLSPIKLGLLTGKEIECLGWCKEGKTNWEIGEILFISEKTVEFHLRNAMRKLGATNRITAVVAALKRGLIFL